MTYAETLKFLYSALPMYQRIGAAAYKKDLHNTLALCRFLGNPERKFKTIHIAGTNGKGSVSHILASTLQEAGIKTGLYTSPHLRDFRERIKINGAWISEQFVVDFVEKVKPLIESHSPSFFELTVAMAFQYFSEQHVEWAVIETGLGGRLDSTNIIKPELSVITNIGLDHTDMLGDTLAQIAYEKAGIIKPKTPALIGESHELTRKVFLTKATEKLAPIHFAEDMLSVEKSRQSGELLHCELFLSNGDSIDIDSPLTGLYQTKNIRTAATACVLLDKNNILQLLPNFAQGVKNVITNTGLEGRWQKLGSNPDIYCDTGHNKDGIKEVVNMLSLQKFRKLWFVLGTVNDKDLSGILPLLPKEAYYIFTKANIPRALAAEDLQKKAAESGLFGTIIPSVQEAIQYAKSQASPDDFIFIGGSTFVVAEAL